MTSLRSRRQHKAFWSVNPAKQWQHVSSPLSWRQTFAETNVQLFVMIRDMRTETQEIIDRAMGLPAADKALVVDKLLSSLDQPDEAIDTLWRKEVEDRIGAYNLGTMKSVSLEEVLAKYRS